MAKIGRLCVAGNSGLHLVQFVNVATKAVVPNSAVTVSMAGCTPGQWATAAPSGPVLLNAYTTYYLVSREAAGGDTWYDHAPIVTTKGAAVGNSIWSSDGINWNVLDGPNTAYGPPNFEY